MKKRASPVKKRRSKTTTEDPWVMRRQSINSDLDSYMKKRNEVEKSEKKRQSFLRALFKRRPKKDEVFIEPELVEDPKFEPEEDDDEYYETEEEVEDSIDQEEEISDEEETAPKKKGFFSRFFRRKQRNPFNDPVEDGCVVEDATLPEEKSDDEMANAHRKNFESILRKHKKSPEEERERNWTDKHDEELDKIDNDNIMDEVHKTAKKKREEIEEKVQKESTEPEEESEEEYYEEEEADEEEFEEVEKKPRNTLADSIKSWIRTREEPKHVREADKREEFEEEVEEASEVEETEPEPEEEPPKKKRNLSPPKRNPKDSFEEELLDVDRDLQEKIEQFENMKKELEELEHRRRSR